MHQHREGAMALAESEAAGQRSLERVLRALLDDRLGGGRRRDDRPQHGWRQQLGNAGKPHGLFSPRRQGRHDFARLCRGRLRRRAPYKRRRRVLEFAHSAHHAGHQSDLRGRLSEFSHMCRRQRADVPVGQRRRVLVRGQQRRRHESERHLFRGSVQRMVRRRRQNHNPNN